MGGLPQGKNPASQRPRRNLGIPNKMRGGSSWVPAVQIRNSTNSTKQLLRITKNNGAALRGVTCSGELQHTSLRHHNIQLRRSSSQGGRIRICERVLRTRIQYVQPVQEGEEEEAEDSGEGRNVSGCVRS